MTTKINFTPPPKPTEFSAEDMTEARRLRPVLRRNPELHKTHAVKDWISMMADKYEGVAITKACKILDAEDEALQKQITSK